MDLSKSKHPTTMTTRRTLTIEGELIEEMCNFDDEMEAMDVERQEQHTEDNKQFTAEHILQLCKFLAEKSKKNKNLYAQPESHKQKHAEAATATAAYDNASFECEEFGDLPIQSIATEAEAEQISQLNHLQNSCVNLTNCDSVCESKSSAITITTTTPSTTHILTDKNLVNRVSATKNTVRATNRHTCARINNAYAAMQYNDNNNNNNNNNNNQNKRDILLMKIRRQIFERKRQRQLAHVQQHFGVWRPW